MKNIYLVGFMGSGKSTIGQILAKKLNLKFVDTDEIIQSIEKTSIKDIFEKKGEEYFRKLERKVIKDLSKEENLVVATGGGLGADRGNMDIMKNSGVVVWLDVSLEEVFNRCGKDENRPVLQLPSEKLEKLYNNRKSTYSLADIIVNVDNKLPEQIVEEIVEKWKSLQE